MADNITLDPGAAGAVVSTEEVTTLNGVGVAAQHVARTLLAFRTSDGVAVDLPGDVTNGLDVDVTRMAPLVAGTAAIGKLAANSGVDIGDVDVTSVPVDPFGLNADAAATAGSTGSMQAKLRLMTSQLDAIKTAVETLDNTVAGSELQVDVLTAPSTPVTNVGTFAVQLSAAGGLTALELIDDVIYADDAATFTPGTSKVAAVGMLADQASTDSVNEGDIGIPRMTLDRIQLVTLVPSADSPGVLTFRSADIDETEEDVKTSAGKLMGYAVYNDHSAEVHLQFWNATAANTTPGTTVPLLTFPIAGGASAHIMFENGITFDTAITVGATAGFSDAAAPGSTVSGTVFYK